MDDNKKRKKKPFDFIEGHKRETRKSYASFLEEATKDSDSRPGPRITSKQRTTDTVVETQRSTPLSGSFPFSSDRIKVEDMSEERVMRKSSRTPVPKKTFDLVDDYNGSHKVLSKNGGSKGNEHKVPLMVNEKALIEVPYIKQEPVDTDSDSAPRKSNRTPIPKRSFDLVDSGYKSGLVGVNSQREEAGGQKKSLKIKSDHVSNKLERLQDEKSGSTKKKQIREKGSSTAPEAVDQLFTQQQTSKSSNLEKRGSQKEKQPSKVKFNFKEQKNKASKKRKNADNETDSKDQVEDSKIVESKAAAIAEDNIDHSVLVEALQALKQGPEYDDCQVDKSENNSEKLETTANEKKGRKSRSKKTPMKLQRGHERDKDVVLFDENVKIKVEDKVEDSYDVNQGVIQAENVNEPGLDCSSSITERSDGHIILTVGGLNSPTKTKKHKKKHKHHHPSSHARGEEFTFDHKIKEEPEDGMIIEEEEHRFLYMQDAFQQSESMIMGESEHINKSGEGAMEKDKKHKSHKKKRKLSVENKGEGFGVDDGLVIKRRKIYKKKKGEKILVRIQTEYWNRHGELVQVEPAEMKEAGKEQSKSNKVSPHKFGEKLQNVKQSQNKQQEQLDMKPTASSVKSISRLDNKMQSKRTKAKQQRKPLSLNLSKTKPASKKSKAKVKQNASMRCPLKKKKERKTQTLTAYLLYCRKYRPQVVAENTKIGFSDISKRLAHMWNEAPEKEREIYKKQLEEHRARVNAVKRKETSKKLKTTKQAGQQSPEKIEALPAKTSRVSSKEFQIAPQKYSVSNVEPVDMAAHLTLLGDSLTLVATALRRQVINRVMAQQSDDLKVYGSLSVLLDSSLCAMAPLIFLTSSIPQLDVIPSQTKANILDNIAYILPGL